VVQVYVQDVESSVARPVRELTGFAKVSVAAGTSQQVSIELDQRAFAFWSIGHRDWVVEAGDFVIAVGSNSRDLPLTETIIVEAPASPRR
jgi:beta-glucosidase